MNVFGVVMAGGSGTRFWPRSRKANPKQLLNLFGDKTLIQDTVHRMEGLIPGTNVYCITNSLQQSPISEQLSQVPSENIIAEPFGRNTAPCVGLAALIVESVDPNGVMTIVPADHVIQPVKDFQDDLKSACNHANEHKGIVTIGIKPTRPETGYGYIHFLNDGSGDITKVDKFVEKPDLETAIAYVEAGTYAWNAGMFIVRADVILEEIKTYMPELYSQLLELKPAIGTDKFNNALKQMYDNIESISIDYGVMEKSDKVYMLQSGFNWSDVGSYQTVYEMSDKDEFGNSLSGDIIAIDSKNSYIYSDKSLVAIVGLEDVVVVQTDDATLVCHRDKVQDVKKIVSHLEKSERNELV